MHRCRTLSIWILGYSYRVGAQGQTNTTQANVGIHHGETHREYLPSANAAYGSTQVNIHGAITNLDKDHQLHARACKSLSNQHSYSFLAEACQVSIAALQASSAERQSRWAKSSAAAHSKYQGLQALAFVAPPIQHQVSQHASMQPCSAIEQLGGIDEVTTADL